VSRTPFNAIQINNELSAIYVSSIQTASGIKRKKISFKLGVERNKFSRYSKMSADGFDKIDN
jgi:hypothetical protein